MIDWTEPNGLQLKALQGAILSAFPEPTDLAQLLRFALEERYAQIVGGGVNYRTAVFQVMTEAVSAGWLEKLVAACIKERPNNPKIKLLLRANGLTGAKPPGASTLEDIVRKEGGFNDVLVWVDRVDRAAFQICRIEYPINQGVGTGWLVGPDLLLTNWHVIRRILSDERKPADYACRFEYAIKTTGAGEGTVRRLAAKWCEAWSPAAALELGDGDADATGDQLDFALLRLADAVGNETLADGGTRGWIRTVRGVAPPADGNILLVLQHESGNPLKLAIGAARGAIAGGARVQHDVDTLGGSSGSPCFNAKMDLVALHNAGDPLYDGVTGAAKTNRAVPIEPILANLAARNAPKIWA